MNLNRLYSLAETEKINVTNYKMINCKARIISDIYTCIFIDYSKIKTQTEEKEIVAEEMGHYYYDSYYNINSSIEDIEKCEYKANKWKALSLCPPSSIIRCFDSGIYDIYDIAEKLDLFPDTVKFAYNYYKDNQLLPCCK